MGCSGDVQGFHRYILGAPAIFIGLSRWGRNPVFDRAWTILSLLLMGALAMPLGLTLSVVFYASLYFMFVQTFGAGDDKGSRTDEDAPDEISPPA